MKKMFNEVAFYLLLIPAGITYFLVDEIIRAKRNKPVKPNHIKREIETTVYPDERLPFNEWCEYIHKQLK
jgi:hypothetical protein